MAMAPMPLRDPEPDPKKVTVSIQVAHGKVRVEPVHVRVRLGQQLQWVIVAFDGSDPMSLEVYFAEATPFRWHDHAMPLIPTKDRRGRPARMPEQPAIVGTPQTPGDYKYGVRLRDVFEQIVDDDDPFITVLA